MSPFKDSPAKFRPQNSESKVLIVEDLASQVEKQHVEAALKDLINIHCPGYLEEITLIHAFSTVYIRFASVEASKKILFELKGRLRIKGNDYNIDYYCEGFEEKKKKVNSA